MPRTRLFLRACDGACGPMRVLICPRALVLLLLSGVLCGWSMTAMAAETRGPQTPPSSSDRYADFIAEAVERFDIPAAWIRAVMRAESDGDARSTSPKGAMGLMQIMPDTWTDLRTRHALGTDPYEPRDNIFAGAAYLREMHDRYGSPGFLAAYNAGPGRYDDYLATGRELPPETRSYVAMLAPLIGDGQVDTTMTINRRAVAWQDAPLFAAHGQKRPVTVQPSMQTPSDRPSAGRSVAGISALAPLADGLFVRHGTARRLP